MAHVCHIHPFFPVLQHRHSMYDRHGGVCIVSSYHLLHRFYENPISFLVFNDFESKYRNQDYRVQNASVSLLLSVLCFIVYGK